MKKPRVKIPVNIYILPNILTTSNLLLGFYSIIFIMNNEFNTACYCILTASLVDALDGRVANLTKTTSKFGAEYDSLCDLVSFGIAPAILMYNWLFYSFNNIGYIIAGLFVCATAIRLARFNIQAQLVEKYKFQGLPSPIAGCLWASFYLAFSDLNILDKIKIPICVVFIIVALLMISNVKYNSLKKIKLKKTSTISFIFIIFMLILMLSYNHKISFFILCMSYILLGWISIKQKKIKI